MSENVYLADTGNHRIRKINTISDNIKASLPHEVVRFFELSVRACSSFPGGARACVFCDGKETCDLLKLIIEKRIWTPKETPTPTGQEI